MALTRISVTLLWIARWLRRNTTRCSLALVHTGQVTVLDLSPNLTGSLSITTKSAVRIMATTTLRVGVSLSIMDVSSAVVAAGLDGLRAEDVVQLVALWVLIDPLLDCGEHVTLDLTVVVAKSWVVEGAENILDDFADWNTWVLPCEENTWNSVLQNSGRNSTSNWVEVVGEMVLGEHGVCWIAARRIVPDNKLLVRRALHDGTRSILQGLADGLNNWTNERCEQAHDEDGNLLTDSFNELLKTWNLRNSSLRS